jgi:16S rRNA (cytosine967-C5)-methyltransferase
VRLAANRVQVSLLPGFGEGSWWVQDAAAAIPAQLLGDVRGVRVLDLCAAPGGKTAQLAAAGAEVTAIDRSPTRLRRLEHNLTRLKLAATTVLIDVLDYKPASPFDAVLLDAPCSGTGTIRRHPDLPLHRKSAEIAELASLQRQLLHRAASFLADKGRLVFATCSLEPEEGESHLLHLPAGMVRVPVEADADGLKPEWIDAYGCVRTRPSQGVDGFFVVRLERR